ncbi:peptidylprolyl isomerase [Polaromonas sp.]|uniref:peptidylprolyl isomerase n=1 Tax=Polaromonas sp. TaxID=1869339 RepID=UPI002FCC09BD
MTNYPFFARLFPGRQITLALLLALPAALAQAQGLKPAGQLGPLRQPELPASNAAVAGLGKGVQRQADFIVAVVNSEPVTNNEVRLRLIRAEQQLTQQGVPLPSRQELARDVLERLINDRAQLQQARASGVRVDDNAVDEAVATVARQNQVSIAELRRRLAADGIAYSRFLSTLRDELMLVRVREREVEQRVRVSEQDIDEFLREQEGQAGSAAPEINLAQILVAVPENASPAQITALQAKAQAALERARAGADFAALAREVSEAPDRAVGGQLGLRSADRYPALFVEATQNLQAGGLAGPVRSGAGFHVLKVIEKKQGGAPGANIVQTRARHILLRPSAQLSEAQAQARLADFKKRLAAGQADFAALARENSQDGSAQEGGDLGWANPGMFVPEFEQVLNTLAPGQVSDPLVSRFGVHLIQVMERRQAQLSQREQREVARSLVREKKLDEAYVVWAQEVRGRAYVEYREPPQ